MSSNSSNGGNHPAAAFRVNVRIDARNNGFPHDEYYNTRIWQSPEDLYYFRERHIYPCFHPEFRLAISKVQPRPQYSYIHSVVSAVIEQFFPMIREPYGRDRQEIFREQSLRLQRPLTHRVLDLVAEEVGLMAERVLTPVALRTFRQVLYLWMRAYIHGSGSCEIISLTPAGLIVFCVCKVVVEGLWGGFGPGIQLPPCSREVKL